MAGGIARGVLQFSWNNGLTFHFHYDSARFGIGPWYSWPCEGHNDVSLSDRCSGVRIIGFLSSKVDSVDHIRHTQADQKCARSYCGSFLPTKKSEKPGLVLHESLILWWDIYKEPLHLCSDNRSSEFLRTLVELRKYENRRKAKDGHFLPRRQKRLLTQKS